MPDFSLGAGRMTEISRIPLANPAQDQAELNGDIIAAVKAVIAQGSYILGPMVARFESQMERWLGVPGAVGVGSGTDALVLARFEMSVDSVRMGVVMVGSAEGGFQRRPARRDARGGLSLGLIDPAQPTSDRAPH
jgi:hypothetical protein